MSIRVLSKRGDDALANVFVAETKDGHRFEFVESAQPPLPRTQKWVLNLSTLLGCPVRCVMCDAGGGYEGRLTGEEIVAQLEWLVRQRYPDLRVPVPHFEVQFARMGDPAFNSGVLDALAALPSRLDAPGLVVSLSSVGPAGTAAWFDELLGLKQRLYGAGRLQLQFSLHTTDEAARRRLVPVRCLSFAALAAYGERFHRPSDRKLTLNFPAARGVPLDAEALRAQFDPAHFRVKLTPLAPTAASRASGLESLLDERDPAGAQTVADRFERAGYETIIAFTEPRENELGSNCGMRVDDARPATPKPRRTLRVG